MYDITYTANPTAVKFHKSDAFVRGWRGPRRAGKSTACCAELFRRGCEQWKGADNLRHTRFAIVRTTYRILSDTTLAPASIYFKYYLHLAMTKAGMGDEYLDWLDIWRKNIDLGLTTWGETSDVETTRSDCHAWGSSPNIEFFRIVLGIESDAPYFEKVKIEPHLGDIKQIIGEMPHPAGTIAVDYDNSGNGLKAVINLPEGISGTFVWEGKKYEVHEGKNNLEL